MAGVEAIYRQDAYLLPTGREAFGFKDSLPDRNFVLGEMGKEKTEEEGEAKRKRKQPRRDRPLEKDQKRNQEDDHECIRSIIRTVESTSQGAVSQPAPVSTRDLGLRGSRDHPVRKCCDATSCRKCVGVFE
jgi:hypothetical protein